ncbi:MAG TPA: peptidylprolyl isomerase [Verrucomicrobiae bacterium]|nr:peptidylprolyl isomerase [Verrucomicrobiae bacterium]
MRIVATAVLLLMLTLPAARAQAAPGELINGILVMVNDQVITYKDVTMAMREDEEFVRQRFGRQPQMLQEKLKALRAETLERMIEDRLVLNEFKSLGRPLPDSYVEGRINEDIKRRFGDRLTAIKTLQQGGVTFESYRDKMRDNTILTLMWNARVPRDPVISPTRMENYYVANQEKYRLEDRVKLRMIVLTNRAGIAPLDLAKEIAKKVDDGASFSEMARIYSIGSQAADGGDWGWVEKKVLREDLAKVAFSLRAGQRSEPIETPTGVYLMYVEQVDPGHIRSLSEVREEIEAALKTEEVKRLRQQFVSRLRKKSFIRYY